MLSGERVPTPHQAVGAAGEQRSVVGKERRRPYRQSWTDQGAREFARLPVDNADRAANTGGGHERAVRRYRQRDYRRRTGFHLAAHFARGGKEIDFSVGAASENFA